MPLPIRQVARNKKRVRKASRSLPATDVLFFFAASHAGLPGGRMIAIGTPRPEPGPVAAAVTGQLDIRLKPPRGLRQLIAFDAADGWATAALMRLGLAQVPVISAGELPRVLQRMAEVDAV